MDDILTNLGVELVEDLDTIFHGDEGLLLTIRAQLPALDVEAFIRTYHTYKELVENDNISDKSSTGGYSFDTSFCEKFKGSMGQNKHQSAEGAQKEANIARRIEGIHIGQNSHNLSH